MSELDRNKELVTVNREKLRRALWESSKRPTRQQFEEALEDEVLGLGDGVSEVEFWWPIDTYYEDLDSVLDEARAATEATPVQDRLWTTADGKTMRVGDMSDKHLRNAIRFLERSGHHGTLSHVTLCSELKRRLDGKEQGERVAHTAEQTWNGKRARAVSGAQSDVNRNEVMQ